MRDVTTYNTLGGNEKVIRTSAATWGELQEDLTSNRINFSGMKAVVGETQVTLESTEAQLPEDDFTLFFTAQKVKSGINDDDYELEEEDEDSYGTDEEAGLIDVDGINWDEEDWEDPTNSIENHSFKTEKDLTIARAKKTISYLNRIVDYLQKQANSKDAGHSEKTKELRQMAKQIEKNFKLFE